MSENGTCNYYFIKRDENLRVPKHVPSLLTTRQTRIRFENILNYNGGDVELFLSFNLNNEKYVLKI